MFYDSFLTYFSLDMNHEKQVSNRNRLFGKFFLILHESKTLICLFLLFFWALPILKPASATQVVSTAHGKGEYLLMGSYLEAYLDSNGIKQAQDFKHDKGLPFQSVQGELSNRPYPNGVYWVRFTVEQSVLDRQWLIELPDPHIDQAELYRYDDAGIIKYMGRLGHALPFSLRKYRHKNLVFALPVQRQTEYLLRLESKMICSFMIVLKNTENFTSYALWEYYMLGIYYGILLIMMLYNLFLYFNLREKNYLFYVFYVISCALYTFREDGVGFQYLWPQIPVLNQWLNRYFELFLLLSFSFYSISFLELRKHTQTVYWIILSDILVYLFLLGLEEAHQQEYPLKQYFYVFPFVLLYAASFYLHRKGNFYIRYYLIAYSFLLLSVLIFQARMLGFIEHTFFTVYIFNFGFILEIVLMSFALGEKIYISTQEKEQAQQAALEALQEKEKTQATLVEQLKEKEELKDRINRELEKKVQERTLELEEKNQKLASMSAQLEAMNSLLDKNNWELNKEVKQKTIASIAGDEITLEDFLNVFPNETACLLYLIELKWKEGYRCQKCDNTKYNKGDTPLSRKCSKCNHRESPTAGTLFHGIKTDLNKAFYITYLSVVSPKKYTLEELSKHLAIGLNTCWKIRKKVFDKRKQMEAKHLPLNKWENYLL